MHALLRPFVEICLLRRRPQDLPASTTLLGVTLTAYLATTLLGATIVLHPVDALLASLLDTTLLALLTATLLASQGHGARIVQTLSALAGSGTLLGLVALPLTAWLHGMGDGAEVAGLPTLLFLALIGWVLAVTAHVLRHALSSHFAVGLVVAVVFLWISATVGQALFAPAV